ncbi:MAG: hypothetical protein HXX10_07640 [Rhodoplanes sp.]|uniref:hypothetical protein n=1 Tax=Rhodoplanes sp. TaxID=1968906 RepID=UPI0017D938D5|nr:hypothetical protein [Rhodoplanes sp.]NVO13893.1 hypothetical protein [Rhodoplanes sp.]
MSTRSKYNAGTLVFFDPAQNYENVLPVSPFYYEDDFVGAGKQAFATTGTQGLDWIKKIVGAAPPTLAGVANAAGGQVQAALTSTSEKQEATLYWADNLQIDMTKGACFEARVKLPVLPSIAGVQAVWGLSSAWADGPDNASYYAEFGVNGSGALLLRSRDGVTTNSKATATTLLATDWHIFRMDATDVTDVKFFVDGVQQNVNNGLAFAATGANAILQPYFGVYKASGVGVGTLLVDYIRLWSNRT